MYSVCTPQHSFRGSSPPLSLLRDFAVHRHRRRDVAVVRSWRAANWRAVPLRCLYPSSAILAREGSSATGEISPSSSSRHRLPTSYPLQSGSVAPKPHPLLQFILPCLSCLPARVARMTRRPFSPARRACHLALALFAAVCDIS